MRKTWIAAGVAVLLALSFVAGAAGQAAWAVWQHFVQDHQSHHALIQLELERRGVAAQPPPDEQSETREEP